MGSGGSLSCPSVSTRSVSGREYNRCQVPLPTVINKLLTVKASFYKK